MRRRFIERARTVDHQNNITKISPALGTDRQHRLTIIDHTTTTTTTTTKYITKTEMKRKK